MRALTAFRNSVKQADNLS